MVGFPLLLVPLAVYNIIAFLMPGVSFTDPLIRLTLLSGEQWQITLSDMLLAAGVLLLLLEVIKGTRPGAKYLTDHLLSLIVFGAAAAEFVLWPKFGNSTYCLLTLLAMVDFISGNCAAHPPPRGGRARSAGAGQQAAARRGRDATARTRGGACPAAARACTRRHTGARRAGPASDVSCGIRAARSVRAKAHGQFAGFAARRPATVGHAAALDPFRGRS
ncbi:hypothetical protein ACVWY2_006133 [Bradyrhizobium sp. JR6.1]